MPEFFNVLSPDEARNLLLIHISHRTEARGISTYDALGWVVSDPIYAPHDLPTFRRSTMDGYAVQAKDTFGATSSLPAVSSVIGEVAMGEAAEIALATGQSALIHTGGMLPADANAVVQIENTQKIDPDFNMEIPYEIEILRPVAVGQNTIGIGEDILNGSQILAAGHYIRAQDIGGLLALGITEINVRNKPRVAIIATGNEIIHPSEGDQLGKIRDINSYTIGSLVRKYGGDPLYCGIVRDEYEVLFDTAMNAMSKEDMVVITAGSSVSARDLTAQVIDNLGQPGLLSHGVATRPGKPTVIGAVHGKPVLGLPGNPVSALVQFLVLGIPAMFAIQGVEKSAWTGIIRARVASNVPSESGREDYVPTRLKESDEGFVAEPVFGKSNLIYSLVHADGLMKVPMNKGGYEAGEWVEVLQF